MANTNITPHVGETYLGLEQRKPATAVLSITGISPSVLVSGSKLITPNTATLKIGLDVANPIIAIATATPLVISTAAPTVNQTQQPVRIPSTASLDLSGQQPGVFSATKSTTKTPSTAVLTITPQLARVQARISPATGSLTLVFQRPAVNKSAGWRQEELLGAKNGSNQDFNVSQPPIGASMSVVWNGVRLVQVAREPVSGEAEYGLSGTSVRLGKAPAAADDVWSRYFHDEAA